MGEEEKPLHKWKFMSCVKQTEKRQRSFFCSHCFLIALSSNNSYITTAYLEAACSSVFQGDFELPWPTFCKLGDQDFFKVQMVWVWEFCYFVYSPRQGNSSNPYNLCEPTLFDISGAPGHFLDVILKIALFCFFFLGSIPLSMSRQGH